MKWLLAIISLVAIIPLAAWLRSKPQNMRLGVVALGLLPSVVATVPELDIALVDWGWWPGFTKGILFSALDILVLSMLIAYPRTKGRIPFLWPMIIYFAAVLLSAANSNLTQPVLFYVWQLLRVFVLYIIILRVCQNRDNIDLVLIGMSIGLVFQAIISVKQVFLNGMFPAVGGYGHQNQLGLVVNLMALAIFSSYLSSKSKILAAGLIAGCVTISLTASRATLGLGFIGFSFIYLLYLTYDFNPRKLLIGIAGIVIAAALTPFVWGTLEQRFAGLEALGDYDERAAMIKTSQLMSNDHPFGIGANNFTVVANVDGYYDRGGVASRYQSRKNMVHNIYYLSLAEIGYFGLIALLILLWQPLKVAIFNGWKYRRDKNYGILLGLGVCIFITYVHSYYEWVFLLDKVQFIYVSLVGIIACLAQQAGQAELSEKASEVKARRRHLDD